MSRLLSDLDPSFQPVIYEFLARLTENKIVVMIIWTRRTVQQQMIELKEGRSWTENSKHLVGKAIDICPYSMYLQHGINKLNWNSEDPVWLEIGRIGESLGLVWGGRWKQRDMGHFEMRDSDEKVRRDINLIKS